MRRHRKRRTREHAFGASTAVGARGVGRVRISLARTHVVGRRRTRRLRARVQRARAAAHRRPPALSTGRSRARFPTRDPAVSARGPAADSDLLVAARHRRRGVGHSGVRRWRGDSRRPASGWTPLAVEPGQDDRRQCRVRPLRVCRRHHARLVDPRERQSAAVVLVRRARTGSCRVCGRGSRDASRARSTTTSPFRRRRRRSSGWPA